jgi:uncharacterized protein (DUF1778 family)
MLRYMAKSTKTEQLQIRVTRSEKESIQRAAARAGLDVSAYVLGRVSSPAAEEFARLTAATGQPEASYAFAELNGLLTRLSVPELREAIAAGIPRSLSPQMANTIAAMVELACAKHQLALPGWVREIPPLDEPLFGSTLQSLRLHLLRHSPPPFRRRNIFVDATLDDQV